MVYCDWFVSFGADSEHYLLARRQKRFSWGCLLDRRQPKLLFVRRLPPRSPKESKGFGGYTLFVLE
jgi:hypothetical protein